MAAATADRAWFDRCVDAARRTMDANHRRWIFSSLGDLRDPALASDALALLLGKTFDLRDTRAILFSAIEQRETRDLTYEWTKAHYDEIVPLMRDDEQSWLLSLLSNFCDEEHREDARAFFGPRAERIDGGPRALATALEKVGLCAEATRRNRAGVEAFLRKY